MPGADKVIRNLQNWAERRRAATIALAHRWAGDLEGKMKTEQAAGTYWINRTHNALLELSGQASVGRDAVRIVLAHGVDYGVYLELARDGQNAILGPTLNAAAPEILDSYRKVWEG